MRGTDYLALADSLARLERECRHARVALNLILAEQDREASKPSRWPDVRQVGGAAGPLCSTGQGNDSSPAPLAAPDYAALTHTVALPDELVERIAECGE